MKAPTRAISPHEMSIILSEIAEFSNSTGLTTWEEAEAELMDAGYTSIEIEQIEREWRRCQPPPPERTPITEDVEYWGDGSFTIEPNWNNGDEQMGKGINLVIHHEFMPMPAGLAVSIAEADRILCSLDRAIVQTGGASHLGGSPTVSLEAALAGDEGVEWGEIYNAVAEAVSADAGHVREAMATMLLALHENLPGSNLAEIGHNLVEDAIALGMELER